MIGKLKLATISIWFVILAFAFDPAQAAEKRFFPLVLERNYDEAVKLIDGPITMSEQNFYPTPLSPSEFVKLIEKCNLHDFFKNDETEELIAIWMCPLDPKANSGFQSKTILVKAEDRGSSITLSDFYTRQDERPAPPSRFKQAEIQ